MRTAGLRRLIRNHKEGESFVSTFTAREVAGNCSRLSVKARTQSAVLVLPQEEGLELASHVTLTTILDKKNIKPIGKRGRPTRKILPT